MTGSPPRERTPLLILGLGNLVCADDGLGIEAVRRITAGWQVPQGVHVLDGGTLGLSLLPWLMDADEVLLLDAVAADARPGTLIRLTGDAVRPAVRHRLSPHQIGVADLIDGADLLGDGPRQISLLGLVPASIELSLERTPEVEAAIDTLVAAALMFAAARGFAFRPHADVASPASPTPTTS
ncbi:MAG: HyaD/HybD family hydrogenase maturation endopeptidase [Myxococcota bacterium]